MDTNGSSALAVVETSHGSLDANVGAMMRRATDVAGVCREIVMKTAMELQGKKYVKVEGWQSIAVAFGCAASSRNVERVPGGFRSIGEVRRMSDGQLIAQAEGFVSEDEPVWFGGGMNKKTGKPYEKRPEAAIRNMAQTRSISRACRSAFAFIVTLIDGKLSTTPYEEAESIIEPGSETPPPPRGAAGLEQRMRPSPPRATNEAPPPHSDADFRPDGTPPAAATFDRNYVMPFANKQNEPLHALSEKSLAWYRTTLTGNIADPEKARFKEKAEKHLELVLAELKFRGV